jgi:hypothetical protein
MALAKHSQYLGNLKYNTASDLSEAYYFKSQQLAASSQQLEFEDYSNRLNNIHRQNEKRSHKRNKKRQPGPVRYNSQCKRR